MNEKALFATESNDSVSIDHQSLLWNRKNKKIWFAPAPSWHMYLRNSFIYWYSAAWGSVVPCAILSQISFLAKLRNLASVVNSISLKFFSSRNSMVCCCVTNVKLSIVYFLSVDYVFFFFWETHLFSFIYSLFCVNLTKMWLAMWWWWRKRQGKNVRV